MKFFCLSGLTPKRPYWGPNALDAVESARHVMYQAYKQKNYNGKAISPAVKRVQSPRPTHSFFRGNRECSKRRLLNLNQLSGWRRKGFYKDIWIPGSGRQHFMVEIHEAQHFSKGGVVGRGWGQTRLQWRSSNARLGRGWRLGQVSGGHSRSQRSSVHHCGLWWKPCNEVTEKQGLEHMQKDVSGWLSVLRQSEELRSVEETH